MPPRRVHIVMPRIWSAGARSYLLLPGFLLASLSPLCVRPSFAQRIPACDSHPSIRANCGLKGPVRTEEIWQTPVSDQDSVVNSAHGNHTIRKFSEQGHLTETSVVRNDGSLESRTTFSPDGRGGTVATRSNGAALHNDAIAEHEVVLYYDAQGNLIRSQIHNDDGIIQVTLEKTFDGNGHELSELHYAPGGGLRDRTDYRYDDQGRLIAEVPQAANAADEGHTEYQYPAPNRRRTLVFTTGFYPRDRQAPASTPTWMIDTTYDNSGREIETVTTAPGLSRTGGWGCGDCLQVGRVLKRYDQQGNLLDEAHYGLDGSVGDEQVYTYDDSGNMLSWTTKQSGSASTSTFSYIFDERRNWTQKTATVLNPNGTRVAAPVEHRKYTYYNN